MLLLWANDMTNADFDSHTRSGERQPLLKTRTAMRKTLWLPVSIVLLVLIGTVSFDTDPPVTGGTEPASPREAEPTQTVLKVASDVGIELQAAQPVPAEIQQLLTRLNSGGEFLRATKGYSATFTQQVFKDGRLFDPERLRLKVQHEPFAVFIEWERDGQQLLYVEGQHDNKLLVHPTRGIGALRRVWTLEPDHRLVMRTHCDR